MIHSLPLFERYGLVLVAFVEDAVNLTSPDVHPLPIVVNVVISLEFDNALNLVRTISFLTMTDVLAHVVVLPP